MDDREISPKKSLSIIDNKSQPVHSFYSLVVMTGMLTLPEGCIAAVISFTTPRDACRLACVSTIFKSASDSDVVWDCFLPPEYSSNSSSASSTTRWSALRKKELYFCTCHNLIHNGKMSFWFDLPSGKKCYMISARELYIENCDDTYDWRWFTIPDADDTRPWWLPANCRFPEVVVRRDSTPFELGGKITTSLLSEMTTYVAYLVFAQSSVHNVDDGPVEVTVGLAGSSNGESRTIYFRRRYQNEDDVSFQNEGDDSFYPKKRGDGWVESELGEFFNGSDVDGELLMTIKTEMMQSLIVQGIEIRPKKE